jgi:hypothetical protein
MRDLFKVLSQKTRGKNQEDKATKGLVTAKHHEAEGCGVMKCRRILLRNLMGNIGLIQYIHTRVDWLG